MTDSSPVLRLSPSANLGRAKSGHPWIFSNEIAMTPEAKAIPPGTVTTVLTAKGEPLGLYHFNPHSLIGARRLTSDVSRPIDAAFFAERLRAALALRDRLFAKPFYRLIHAEGDGLPGLIIDRFGEAVVIQANTAGMDRALDALTAALDDVLAPARIILRNDSPIRALEGLEERVAVLKGAESGPVWLEENGLRFTCDPAGGQKTGWFYDHRDNRAFIARLAGGAKVLDLYSYAGGFALACAAAGAEHVTAVDRSEASLALAQEAAQANELTARLTAVKAEAFAEMERLAAEGRTFDVVIADPPAFVKSKKTLPQGLQGYRKMSRLAARLVAPGGFLLAASCSHNASAPDFFTAVRRGLQDAGRTGRILRESAAGPDHPVHPALPETAYLKAVVLQLD